MDSKWDMNSDIVNDLKFAISNMKNTTLPKKPKRIECTKETYSIISGEIKSRKEKYNDLVFPWGNPFDILFVQTDFSKWSDEDIGNGYKAVY